MDTHFVSALRLLALSLLVPLLLAAHTAPAGAAARASYPAMLPDTYESRVHALINLRRAEHGLPPLRTARCTERVAEAWGSFLAVNNAFYHQSMDALLERCNAYYAGETLGRGSDMTPRMLVRMWMRSSEHRAVLLSPRAARIGVGAYPDASGRWVVAADFMRF